MLKIKVREMFSFTCSRGVGVSGIRSTRWQIKYLEKDGDGQYPSTVITDVKVTEKRKG